MKKRIAVAAVAALVLAWAPSALAQAPKSGDCPQPSASPGTGSSAAAPAKIEGTVTNVDRIHNTVTLSGSDGQTHQFQADPDTLKDMKVGDHLEAQRRMAAGC